MKAHLREGLWRELEKIAADLAEAKERGTAKAAEYGFDNTPMRVNAFEQAWTEHACKEAAARIRSLCDSYLVPKRRSRKAA